jgi:hypothetical protein
MSEPITDILGTEDVGSPARAAHLGALRGESSVYEDEWRGRIYSVHVVPLHGPTGRIEGTVGAAIDITACRRGREERTLQRERQARLDGMLFAARELASRVNRNLATSSVAIAALQPESVLAPHLREAIDAATVALSEATRAMTELQRLIPPAPPV